MGKFTTDTVITAPQNALDPNEEVFYQYYEAYPDAFAGHLKSDRYEPSMPYRNSEGNARNYANFRHIMTPKMSAN